jgi:hypothetical protein
MKRILFLLFLGSMFILLGQINLSAQAYIFPENLHIYPYLQYATPTSIIIKWETINPTEGKVTYSEDISFNNEAIESTPVKIHEIKLDGLKPGTRYNYKVSYDNTTLESASFTTAPVPGTQNWRMVAYGDNRTYPETHKRIVSQILKLNPSMIIHSGDLVARGNDYAQWKQQYFDPMKGLSENITVFPSLGNHEMNSPFYYEYMSLPDENDESYYSFDYGNAHFIALNSNEREAPFEIDSEQTKWLIKDLKENADAEWKIVFFHHPLFRCHPTRGIEPQRWVWQQVFEDYGVDLVVNGHDHYYQRTYGIGSYQGQPSRGIYHLISGGGGAPNYPIVPKVHAANRRSVHHITVMDFLGDRLIGRAIDDEGNIFDAFVYDKEAENSPEEFIASEVYKIERDLAEAIIHLPIEEIAEKVKISRSLEIENPFQHPLKMTFSWESTHNWNTNLPKTELIQPGESIKIKYMATAKKENIFPIPTARLHFQTPEGKMAFKNNTIVFNPLKVWENKLVQPLATKKTPIIDGNLADTKWNKNTIITQFMDVQGSLPSQKTAFTFSSNKSKSVLYVAGKVEASPEYSTSGITERDHRYIARGENIKIHIGVGKEVYTYVVNPKGALMDLSNGEVWNAAKWNSKASCASLTNENGWQFEIGIPLDELNIKNQKTTINFSRSDAENNAEYEFAMTFGRSGLDHHIPMYRSDWLAVDRFAKLVLNR